MTLRSHSRPCIAVLLFTLALPAHADGEAPWSPTTSGPFTTTTAPLPPPGQLTLQPLFFYSSARGNYDPEGGYAPLAAVESFKGLTLHLFSEYGLTQRFGFGAQLSAVHNRIQADGREASTTGLGDTLVFGRYTAIEQSAALPHATLLALLKVPTARYQSARPELLGSDIAGTGTWDVTLGLSLTKALRPAVMHLDTFLTLPASVTVDGVLTHHGPQLFWSAAVELPFLGDRLAFMVELTGRHEPDQTLDGLRAPGTRVNDLLLATGLEVIFSEQWQLLVGYQRTLWGTNIPAVDVLAVTVVPTLRILQ